MTTAENIIQLGPVGHHFIGDEGSGFFVAALHADGRTPLRGIVLARFNIITGSITRETAYANAVRFVSTFTS